MSHLRLRYVTACLFAVFCCTSIVRSAPAPVATPAPAAPAALTTVTAEAVPVTAMVHSPDLGGWTLAQGLDGSVYIGTGQDAVGAHVLEVDPETGQQRVIIDATKSLPFMDTNPPDQLQVSQRMSVAPSGRLYVGTNQGPSTVPHGRHGSHGGTVLINDPRILTTESLDFPYPGDGVGDVLPDEDRGLIYVVTTDAGRWMLHDDHSPLKGGFNMPGKWRELGPRLAPGATTLIDARGHASVITADFRLAQFDPVTAGVSEHDILIDGKPANVEATVPASSSPESPPGRAVPRPAPAPVLRWALSPDGHTAYFLRSAGAKLYSLDLFAVDAPRIEARSHALLLPGEHAWVPVAPVFAPDGLMYAGVRVDTLVDGTAHPLYHLVRYDPKTNKPQDLGVIALHTAPTRGASPAANPEAPGTPTDKSPIPNPKSQILSSEDLLPLTPETAAPLSELTSLIAMRDGTLYAMFQGSNLLARIDATRVPPPPAEALARQYVAAALRTCDRIDANMGQFTRVAEVVAARHLKGGAIDFPYNYQAVQQEIGGRAGSLVHMGYGRVTKANATPEGKANNVWIISWERKPGQGELARLEGLKKQGGYIIGFGARDMPELAPFIPVCDAFFDSGGGADDRVLTLPDGTRVGRVNTLNNVLNAWTFVAELVGALTRQGKMPPIWKAFLYTDSFDWDQKYYNVDFHTDFAVPPVPPGELGRRFLRQARYHMRAFGQTQLPGVELAARAIAEEHAAGRKTIVSGAGHIAWVTLGKFDDAAWAENHDLEVTVPSWFEDFRRTTPDGALVLRLGYCGFHKTESELFQSKHQRVLLITADDPDPDYRWTENLPVQISTIGAFGDAIVPIEGYPLRICPFTGFMQELAYESVDAEVLGRIDAAGGKKP